MRARTEKRSTFCAFRWREGPVGLSPNAARGPSGEVNQQSAFARCSLAAKKWQCRDPPEYELLREGKDPFDPLIHEGKRENE